MAYKIDVSEDAHRDLDEIITYIALVLTNATAAIKLLDKIEKSYQSLVDNPYLYSLCDDASLQEKGYRKIAINNYLVLYRIDGKRKKVFVVRILYGARNYVKLL